MDATVVLYTAKWCGPCKQFKKSYWKQLKKDFPEVEFREVDIEKTDEDVSSIASIPYVVVQRSGNTICSFKNILAEVDRLVSFLEEELD